MTAAKIILAVFWVAVWAYLAYGAYLIIRDAGEDVE